MYSKMQGRGGFGGNGLWLLAPFSSNTMISPGSMSRTYLAPIMSSAQRLDETVDETVALGLRDQVQDHFGVGGRLHHGAVAHQFAAQRQPVGEVAIVADRESAGVEFGEQRLHVAQDGS